MRRTKYLAKWRIAPKSGCNRTAGQKNTGKQSAVVIGVEDISVCRSALLNADIDAGEITDYGFAQTCDAQDNRLTCEPIMA